MNPEVRSLLNKLKQVRSQHNEGYVLDNLGLPVWLVNKIKNDPQFEGQSTHYAIQQILKQQYQ